MEIRAQTKAQLERGLIRALLKLAWIPTGSANFFKITRKLEHSVRIA